MDRVLFFCMQKLVFSAYCFYFILLYLYVFCLPVYLYSRWVSGSHRGQKWASNTIDCEPHGFWELTLSPLHEYPVILLLSHLSILTAPFLKQAIFSSEFDFHRFGRNYLTATVRVYVLSPLPYCISSCIKHGSPNKQN